jgi:hypothetical protein
MADEMDETTTGYAIWNATDGVFFDPRTFETEEEASQIADELRARYSGQGHYRTAGGHAIDAADLELEIVPITE